MNCYTFFTGL